jgi:hypothetical protein
MNNPVRTDLGVSLTEWKRRTEEHRVDKISHNLENELCYQLSQPEVIKMNYEQIAVELAGKAETLDDVLNVGNVNKFGERNPGAAFTIVLQDGSVIRVTSKQIAAPTQ